MILFLQKMSKNTTKNFKNVSFDARFSSKMNFYESLFWYLVPIGSEMEDRDDMATNRMEPNMKLTVDDENSLPWRVDFFLIGEHFEKSKSAVNL